MLAIMNEELFNSLDNASIIWACIEPTVMKIRGKDFKVKRDAYDELTAGQRALLMFQIIYGHSSSGILQFFSYVPYVPSGKGIWHELKKAMEYFKDYSMQEIFAEMEKDYIALEEKSHVLGTERIDLSISSIEDKSELALAIGQHDKLYREAIPETIKLIGIYIRNNPSEFVQLDK